MLNYVKSEWYRNIRNRNNYVFLLGLILFIAMANILLGVFAKSQINFPYGTTKYALSSLYSSLAMPFILCFSLVSITFGQEHKHNTMKNAVAFGISRHQIYLGKIIVSWSIAVVNLICISGAHILFAYLMLENSGNVYLYELLSALFACLPLFTLALVAGHSICFAYENEWTVSAIWFVLMVVIPQVLSLIGRRVPIIKSIANWLPWNIIRLTNYDETLDKIVLRWNNPEVWMKTFMVGIVGSMLFYAIGLQLFRKKEIR